MKRTLFHLITIILLTLLTQVGGIVWLLVLLLNVWIQKRNQRMAGGLRFLALFVFTYLIVTWMIVPPMARQFGRVPLPVFSNPQVRPLNFLTCLLNRHYVTPGLFTTVEIIGFRLSQKEKHFQIRYLDANFPFFEGFPLLPHRSHDDGKKIDFSFIYSERRNLQPAFGKSRSWLGYGVFENPGPGEINTTHSCKSKGNWQYEITKIFGFGAFRSKLILDGKRTRSLLDEIVFDQNVHKVFIEPHLKSRFGLHDGKVRFHGCKAVRHDDHIHVETYH